MIPKRYPEPLNSGIETPSFSGGLARISHQGKWKGAVPSDKISVIRYLNRQKDAAP
jgi:hypothetical protein